MPGTQTDYNSIIHEQAGARLDYKRESVQKETFPNAYI